MIPEPLSDLLETLAMFEDRTERIDALIAIGQRYRLPSPDEVPRTEVRKVPGCESEVFLQTEPLGDGLRFRFAVDNPQGVSAMALAEILDQGLSGQPLGRVLDVPDEMVYEVFGRELSMGKSLGLQNMVRMVKGEARRSLASV
jgi:cysteine desulfuration protein SufE